MPFHSCLKSGNFSFCDENWKIEWKIWKNSNETWVAQRNDESKIMGKALMMMKLNITITKSIWQAETDSTPIHRPQKSWGQRSLTKSSFEEKKMGEILYLFRVDNSSWLPVSLWRLCLGHWLTWMLHYYTHTELWDQWTKPYSENETQLQLHESN